jgi:hypothetical protein
MTAEPGHARKAYWAALAVAIGVTGIFFVDVCNAVFACGCTSVWRGAAAACNIHHLTGPHCPWCAHPYTAGATAFLGAAAAQAAMVLAPLPLSLPTRFAAALLAFPIVGGLLGLIQGNWYGYWG